MDINLVAIILLTMVIVGFSLHRAITLKSLDAQNKIFYDLNKELKANLEKCKTPEESQAVITTFIFKSSALIDKAENAKREGVAKVRVKRV